MKAFADGVHAAFHRPDTRIYQVVQGGIWILIALSVLLLGVELFVGRGTELREDLAAVDRWVLAIFALELVLRVGSYRPKTPGLFEMSPPQRLRFEIEERIRFCLHPLILIDIITVAALVPGLRGLRVLRLLRLLRSSRVFRYANPFQGLARAFRENAVLFTFAFSLFGSCVLLGGLSFYLTEVGKNPDLSSLADAFWWAVVTLTTVGFGDISPVTGVGRLVASVIMIAGMFNLALFAGVVGNTLLHAVLSVREEQFRMSGFIDHLVICGYDPGARMLLDALLQEPDLAEVPAVLFSLGERPQDVPPELMWVNGDPTKESELDKVRVTHARAAILVGSRTASPQHSDATTILTAFTLRRYLERQPETAKRLRPLYVVAEILDAENVEHAYSAGADEVIETTRLGFSLMAHAVVMPGTAAVASEMATTGANSLFVGRVPEQLAAHSTYGQMARFLRTEHGTLLLGIRDSQTGEDRLIPEESCPVRPGDQVIYLAKGQLWP